MRKKMKTRIKEYRKELKMTQEELAEAVNVTRQTNPSLVLAYLITKALKKRYIEDVFLLDELG